MCTCKKSSCLINFCPNRRFLQREFCLDNYFAKKWLLLRHSPAKNKARALCRQNPGNEAMCLCFYIQHKAFVWEEWISTPSLDLFHLIRVVPEVTEGFVTILNVSWPFFFLPVQRLKLSQKLQQHWLIKFLAQGSFLLYPLWASSWENAPPTDSHSFLLQIYSTRLEARLVHVWGLYSAGLRLRGPCPQSFLHLTTDPLHLTTTALQPHTVVIKSLLWSRKYMYMTPSWWHVPHIA